MGETHPAFVAGVAALGALSIIFGKPLIEIVMGRFFRNGANAQTQRCYLDEKMRLQLHEIHTSTARMEAWHAPDSHGEQSWKGTGIERNIERLTAETVRLIKITEAVRTEIREGYERAREGQERQTETIRKGFEQLGSRFDATKRS